ncbi:MAG: hypothetical protein GQ564_22295 [Bacteroidales bacterium]|nr:hypothetical protein [Bacteroidales bacterium]
MKKLLKFTLILHLIFANLVNAQSETDSLIRFSDLKYHSDFEEQAILDFIKDSSNALNLFLAIDENISNEDAKLNREVYLKIYSDLALKKIESKKINKKIKLSYSNVHKQFLKKYSDNEYFPEIFKTGKYNCVSASMLYALVFNELKIPYKVKASSSHVYLVANPGSKSIVIETTNPNFEKAIFNGEFKQNYVNYLRTSKLISDSEYKNKSTEEIFEEKFKEVKDAKYYNLPGFQYYNKAFFKLQNNDIEAALTLSQKAYYFYPDNQVKTLLYMALLYKIEKCNFDKVSDIDFLAQLSRFENIDLNTIKGLFNNIVNNKLKYTDTEQFCDSLCQRLISQISDQKIIDEINFSYNMQMSYRHQNSDKVEKYITKALKIKDNYVDANKIMEHYLFRKFNGIHEPYALLDSINILEKRCDFERITPLFKEYKSIAFLKIANYLYGQKKITEGNKYLKRFEENFEPPIVNPILEYSITNAYRSIAIYYYYRGSKTRAKSYVDKGLKYVPNSRSLESVFN